MEKPVGKVESDLAMGGFEKCFEGDGTADWEAAVGDTVAVGNIAVVDAAAAAEEELAAAEMKQDISAEEEQADADKHWEGYCMARTTSVVGATCR